MKKHRPVKHAHRKAMIAEKKAKGRYSRCDLPKRETCASMYCLDCWAFSVNRRWKTCVKSWCNI